MKTRILLIIISYTLIQGCMPGTEEPRIITVKGMYTDTSYEVEIPGLLSPQKDLNEVASLQYGNKYSELYIIVVDEKKSDLKEYGYETLQEYSDFALEQLTSVSTGEITMESTIRDTLKTGKRIRYTFNAPVKDLLGRSQNIFYMLSVMETPDNMYQLVTWCLGKKRKRHEEKMMDMVNSFRERSSEEDLDGLSEKNKQSGLFTPPRIEGKGLDFDRGNFVLNGMPLRRNTVEYGDSIRFNITGVRGFKEEDHGIYPEIQILVKNAAGDTVYKSDNLLPEEKTTPGEKGDFEANTRIHPFHFAPDRPYQLIFYIRDKKGKGEIRGEVPLQVKKSEADHIKVTSEGGLTGEVMVTSYPKAMVDNTIPLQGFVGGTFYDLKGFGSKNGKAYPGGTITLLDPETRQIQFQTDDLYKTGEEGFDIDLVLKEGFTIPFELSDSTLRNKKFIWQFRLWDKTSKASMTVELPLTVE